MEYRNSNNIPRFINRTSKFALEGIYRELEGFPDSSVGKESICNAEDPYSWEDLLEKGYATHSSILGFPLWLS